LGWHGKNLDVSVGKFDEVVAGEGEIFLDGPSALVWK